MSVQVKKKFEELVAYLGKDTKGLEKVKQLKDAVNELRKKLAAAEERLEQVEAVKDAARERADAAEAETAEAESRQVAAEVLLQRVQQELTSQQCDARERRQRNLAENAKLAAILTAPVINNELGTLSEVLRKVKETTPVCIPAVCGIKLVAGTLRIYDRQRLAAGWSDEDLWLIGAIVSLLSAHYGVVGFVQAGTESERLHLTEDGKLMPSELGLDLSAQLIRWADTNDHYRNCDIDTLMDKVVTSVHDNRGSPHERESQEVC